MKVNIFNIQHFSLQDGDGIRTVIFFKGCPLSCKWCHNPESKTSKPQLAYYEKKCTNCKKCQLVCPNNVHIFLDNQHIIDRKLCIGCGMCVDACDFAALEMFGRSVTVDEIMEDISKDDVFFATKGGVTFSGGEPFAQVDALEELAKRCKEKGYSVFLETSGYTTENNLERVIPYVDCFLYDCKETDSENHLKYTGERNDLILRNLCILDLNNCNVRLRCPIIPDVNDRREHYIKIAELANAHNCIKSVEIMPYHPLGISKCEQIGMEVKYDNRDFLSEKTADECISTIKQYTDKSVSLGK